MKLHRMQMLAQALKENKLDCVVYATGPSLQYVLDATHIAWQRMSMNNIAGQLSALHAPDMLLLVYPDASYQVICIPSRLADVERYTHVQVSYMDQMEDMLRLYVKGNRIAVGANCHAYLLELLQEIDSVKEIVDGEHLLDAQRMIKDADEIHQLRHNAAFTDQAVRDLLPHLKEGITQLEVENWLMHYGMEHGADDFAFSPTAGFVTRDTEHAKTIFQFDPQARLVEGTAIAFDLGYVMGGYCSDWGRTLFYGTPTSFIQNGYDALQAGQQAMIAGIVPHVTNIRSLHKMVHDKTIEHGYGDYLRFVDTGSLGHQIGIDCHEHPMLNNNVDFILRPGMVFCSEPKMWFANECYMRVEDMILVTETGAESLSQFNRTLFAL